MTARDDAFSPVADQFFADLVAALAAATPAEAESAAQVLQLLRRGDADGARRLLDHLEAHSGR